MWFLEEEFSTLKYNFIISIKISGNIKVGIKQCLIERNIAYKRLRKTD